MFWTACYKGFCEGRLSQGVTHRHKMSTYCINSVCDVLISYHRSVLPFPYRWKRKYYRTVRRSEGVEEKGTHCSLRYWEMTYINLAICSPLAYTGLTSDSALGNFTGQSHCHRLARGGDHESVSACERCLFSSGDLSLKVASSQTKAVWRFLSRVNGGSDKGAKSPK